MKFLFVINSLGTGGAERSLAEMLPYFRQAGVECEVIVLYLRDEGVQKSVVDAGFDVYELQAKRFPSRVRELRRILDERKPDLVHSSLADADFVARAACLGRSVPLVNSLVNMPYEPARQKEDRNVSGLRLRVVQLIDATSSVVAVKHFHAITHAVRASASRRLAIPLSRITVVHRGRDRARLGINDAERRAKIRSELGVPESQLVILNAARREYQKGQCYLLEAVAELREDIPDLLLLIAGREGNASADLTAKVKERGLDSHVRFLGHRTDVPDLLCAADVFCLPSLWEGLGGVLLEALGLGVPIVASRLPPTEEILRHEVDTLLVTPRASKDLAKALRCLLESPEMRSKFSSAGQAAFETQFNQEVIAASMLELFQRVARGR